MEYLFKKPKGYIIIIVLFPLSCQTHLMLNCSNSTTSFHLSASCHCDASSPQHHKLLDQVPASEPDDTSGNCPATLTSLSLWDVRRTFAAVVLISLYTDLQPSIAWHLYMRVYIHVGYEWSNNRYCNVF